MSEKNVKNNRKRSSGSINNNRNKKRQKKKNKQSIDHNSKAEKKQKRPRIFVRIPVAFLLHWEKKIGVQKKSKSKNERKNKYEYGFTKAVHDLKLDPDDFAAAVKTCATVWGKKRWCELLHSCGCGREISQSSAIVRKRRLALAFMATLKEHVLPNFAEATAVPKTKVAIPKPAAETTIVPKTKVATSTDDPLFIQLDAQVKLLSEILALRKKSKLSCTPLFDLPLLKKSQKEIINIPHLLTKTSKSHKPVITFLRRMFKVTHDLDVLTFPL